MARKAITRRRRTSRVRPVDRGIVAELIRIFGGRASSGGCDCGVCGCETMSSGPVQDYKVGDVKAVKKA